MSSEKYATEENLRSLIVLIREELKNYVKKDDLVFGGGSPGDTSGSSGNYVTADELENILSEKRYVTTEDLDSRLENISGGSGLTFEMISGELPDQGEPNVIYLKETGEGYPNMYEEYIWIDNQGSFELLGSNAGGSSEDSGFTFEVHNEFSELPGEGEDGVIYLVYNGEGYPNQFDEYIWVSNIGSFELVGPKGSDGSE